MSNAVQPLFLVLTDVSLKVGSHGRNLGNIDAVGLILSKFYHPCDGYIIEIY